MNKHWEHFDHQADIGIRGYGRTMAEAFEQAGVALTSVVTPVDRVGHQITVRVQCEAPDREMLFADWLNTILREMSALRMLFSEFRVGIEGNRLTAELAGEAIDPAKHEPATEVKGASYHHLRVEQDAGGTWMAQCVVDV
jgi:SHS2 domain-containing protein